MRPVAGLRWGAALAAVVLLAGCLSLPSFRRAPHRTILAAERVTLPTFTHEGSSYLIVAARINGAGPFKLVVDTGAESILLSQTVADAAGLKPRTHRPVTVINAAAGQVPAHEIWLDRLETGGLILEGVAAVVVHDDEHADVKTLTNADGILGLSALKDLILEMDFAAKQVTVARLGTARYPADRALVYTGELPTVTVDLAGRAERMVIDTGFEGVIKLPNFDEVPLLVPIAKAIGMGAVVGKVAAARGVTSQLAGDAKVGPVTLTNPPLFGGRNEEGHGLLGAQALSHGTLVVNQRERRLYFLGENPRRSWPASQPDDPRFGLGFFAEIEGSALRLIEVDPGGAADLAGLRAGDLLLTVDGTPAATPRVADYRSRIRAQRDGEDFETTLIFAPDYTPRQTLLAANRVPLPTTSRLGPLVVEARINGAGPYRFLVSTRSLALSVGQHVADAAGLKALADWRTGRRGPAAKVVWVDQLAAGGLSLKGLAANVTDPAAIANASALLGPIDGFLGMEAWKDVVLELDFPARQVFVVKAGTELYAEERAVAYRGGLPRGRLEIAGRAVTTWIDTTSAGGFELPMLDELPLLQAKTKMDGVSFGRAGPRGERGQLAGEARMGAVTWVRPPITRGSAARIGTRALGQWRLAIDQHANKLYFLDGDLQRTANEVRPPADLQFKPGYFARAEGTGLRLVEVDADGAFDRAGLQPGDLIVRVDDMPAAEYARQPGFFTARTKARPTLRVQRDGAEIEVVVVLAAETAAVGGSLEAAAP